MKKIISFVTTLLLVVLTNSVNAQGNCADSVLYHSTTDRALYRSIRGGLANCYLQFTKNKTGRVAFMGGSITDMKGWRDMVCKYLTERFPDTKFEFIHAGIPSTGSTPGAFRLERDVLSKGKIDLLFEEAAVNDNGQAETTNIRGMEGIVRHALVSNPYTDIVLMYFVDPRKIKEYNEGKTPLTIACHDSVARHYNLPSLNLAKEVTDRINAGEFTWDDDFKNLHPSPFGHELYFLSMRAFLENCWDMALSQKKKRKPHIIPSQMDLYSFTHGAYRDIHQANRSEGWFIDEKWTPTDNIPTRKGYVDVPMLVSSTPGSEITFTFEGTAIGICNVAGPDAGIIEYSIDGGEYQRKDLFTPWSDRLHMNLYLVFDDMLSDTRHELKIRISESKNEKSIGHACRIVHFLVNKPTFKRGRSHHNEIEEDPFQSYLTGKQPQILKELGEEIHDGVKVRKLIFYSREIQTPVGKDTTKIFAVITRPLAAGHYPGLLILHGGGGNAETDMAIEWSKQGYIALVLDEPGIADPEKVHSSDGKWKSLVYGQNRFTANPGITASTLFDGVLAAVQGLYLLHSQPDVIKERIGVTGISWGGYLTTIVSGLGNSMVNASFSVFGSGFYDHGSTFLKELNKMTPDDRAVWLKYLDAGRRANNIKSPFFTAAATNDNWFYPPAVEATLRSVKGPVNHLFAANVSHSIPLPGGTKGQGSKKPGWLEMEQIYFDYFLKGVGDPLPVILKTTQKNLPKKGSIYVKFKVKSPNPVREATVYYSQSGKEWTERKWFSISAFAKKKGWYEAELPVNDSLQVIDWFASISDARPVTVSSYMVKSQGAYLPDCLLSCK